MADFRTHLIECDLEESFSEEIRKSGLKIVNKLRNQPKVLKRISQTNPETARNIIVDIAKSSNIHLGDLTSDVVDYVEYKIGSWQFNS